MKVRLALVCLALSSLSALESPATRTADEIRVGSLAPRLDGEDSAGRRVDWKSHDGKAIILYFHSDTTRKADAALVQLNVALEGDTELASKSVVYAVLERVSEADTVRAALQPSGVEVRVAVSPERKPHEAFGVIVYPSAYVFAADGVIIDIVRGFGPLLSFQITSAARLAAGMTDEEEYRKLRDGGKAMEGSTSSKVTRIENMVRRLVESGKDEVALDVLRQSVSEESTPRVLAVLLTRILLRAGLSEEASLRMERLATFSADDPELTLLRAQLAVMRGQLPEAEELLQSLDARDPHVLLVRGRVLEAQGQWQEAATHYRETLNSLLLFEHP